MCRLLWDEGLYIHSHCSVDETSARTEISRLFAWIASHPFESCQSVRCTLDTFNGTITNRSDAKFLYIERGKTNIKWLQFKFLTSTSTRISHYNSFVVSWPLWLSHNLEPGQLYLFPGLFFSFSPSYQKAFQVVEGDIRYVGLGTSSGGQVQFWTTVQTWTFLNLTSIRFKVWATGGTRPLVQSLVWG
jgi:hypothetical protein